MKVIYKPKRSKSFAIFLIIVSLLVITSTFAPIIFGRDYSRSSLLAGNLAAWPIILLFIWFWTNTRYIVDGELIIIVWGPVRWKVKIKNIRFIRTGQDAFAGIIRPSLAWKCLEIRHGKYKSIFIAPLEEEKMIKQLRELNNHFEIK